MAMAKSLAMWSGKSAMFAPMRASAMFCTGANDLLRGTCKWFDSQKGFGFITVDNEERDVSWAGGKRARHARHHGLPRWHCRHSVRAGAEPSPVRGLQFCCCFLQQVFVHQRNIHADGFRSLAEGEPLEFQIKEDSRSGKVQTRHPQLARSPALQALPTDGTDGLRCSRPQMAAFNVTGPDGAAVQGAPRRDQNDRYDDGYRNDY